MYIHMHIHTIRIYWLAGWPAGCLAAWLTDWRMDGRTDGQTDGRTDWLTEWMTDWLAGWLTDWLTDPPTDWLTSVYLSPDKFLHGKILMLKYHMDSAKVLYCSSIYMDDLTGELTGNAKFFQIIPLFFLLHNTFGHIQALTMLLTQILLTQI